MAPRPPTRPESPRCWHLPTQGSRQYRSCASACSTGMRRCDGGPHKSGEEKVCALGRGIGAHLDRIDPRLHGAEAPRGSLPNIVRVLRCDWRIVQADDGIVPVDARAQLARVQLAAAPHHCATPKSGSRCWVGGVAHQRPRQPQHVALTGAADAPCRSVTIACQAVVTQASRWVVQEQRRRKRVSHEQRRRLDRSLKELSHLWRSGAVPVTSNGRAGRHRAIGVGRQDSMHLAGRQRRSATAFL